MHYGGEKLHDYTAICLLPLLYLTVMNRLVFIGVKKKTINDWFQLSFIFLLKTWKSNFSLHLRHFSLVSTVTSLREFKPGINTHPKWTALSLCWHLALTHVSICVSSDYLWLHTPLYVQMNTCITTKTDTIFLYEERQTLIYNILPN